MTTYEAEVSIHDGVRGRRAANPNPYQTDFEWFADATADTGTSHIKIGRPYVVMCQWTGALFIAPTYKEALEMFRDHEQQMFRYAEEIRSKRDTTPERNQK